MHYSRMRSAHLLMYPGREGLPGGSAYRGSASRGVWIGGGLPGGVCKLHLRAVIMDP